MQQKDQLHLPQTTFPRKVSTHQLESTTLARWKARELYKNLLEKNKDKPNFIVHDGPPYASGEVQPDRIRNKILKDLIVRYRNMNGYHCNFKPGWDCHGLPIELNVESQLREQKKTLSPLAFRQACREYAQSSIEQQADFFQKLGILGDWQSPYTTMEPSYEATITRILAQLLRDDALEHRVQPVHWCVSCHTALAEFEVEYKTKSSPSIYVGLPLISDPVNIDKSLRSRNIEFIVWLNQPWMLTATQAIAINPEETYTAIRHQRKVYIIGKQTKEQIIQACGWNPSKVEKLLDIQGKELLNVSVRHPLIHRQLPLIFSDKVNQQKGSGIACIAPGHDPKDYQIGKQEGLEYNTFINEKGLVNHRVEKWTGLSIPEITKRLFRELKEFGVLLNNPNQSEQRVAPHCWRCSKPVMFRATPQWFLLMDSTELRQKTIEATEKVEWVPEKGKEQMRELLRSRSDWCLSRQRAWGVPLPFFYCKRCQTPLKDPEHIEKLAALYEKEAGADIWFEESIEELIPKYDTALRCRTCGNQEFRKGTDIVDVWFDSAVSHEAVMRQRFGKDAQADVYIEGPGQYKGWFQGALLTSVQLHQKSPYKSVLTHGALYTQETFPEGFPAPQELIEKFGAETIRIWMLLQKPSRDIHLNREALSTSQIIQKKIRNTLWFLLANLSDFQPEKDNIDFEKLLPLDQFMQQKATISFQNIQNHYESYDFHKCVHALYSFCHKELSAFYFHSIKQRLYTSEKNGSERRSAQSTLFWLGSHFLKLLAPISCFTADEAWQLFPKTQNSPNSIHLTDFPKLTSVETSEKILSLWKKIQSLRQNWYQAQNQTSFSSPKALRKQSVEIYTKDKELHEFIKSLSSSMRAEILGVAGCQIHHLDHKSPSDLIEFNTLNFQVRLLKT